MKNTTLITIASALLLFLSCSSDDAKNPTDATNKRIVQYKYQDLENTNNKVIVDVKYDESGNITTIIDKETGNVRQSFSYNSQNQLISQTYFGYSNPNNTISTEKKSTYTYVNNKISNINQNTKYFYVDAEMTEQNIEYIISHSDNLITSETKNEFGIITKVEFGIENNLITKIKVYENEMLESNFSFTYDAEGNCISGTGPTKGFSLDNKTDNIDLKVTYSAEIKKPFMDFLFWPEILDNRYFESFREMLVRYRGTKYPATVEWFKYDDYTYKEIYDNKFDEDGYLKSILLSRIPDLPNYGEYTYKWE